MPQLSIYLDLLLKWNARTNLTAIRDPEEIVRRHFGESLFAAQHIGRLRHPPRSGLRSRLPRPPHSPPPPRDPRNPGRIPEQEIHLPPRSRPHLRPQNVEIWAARAESMPRHPPIPHRNPASRRQHGRRHSRRHPPSHPPTPPPDQHPTHPTPRIHSPNPHPHPQLPIHHPPARVPQHQQA